MKIKLIYFHPHYVDELKQHYLLKFTIKRMSLLMCFLFYANLAVNLPQ